MTSTDPGPHARPTDGPTDGPADGVAARAAVRPTRQRRAVAAALDSLEEFRSAQQIHDLLLERGERVGLATVYRTLQLMAELGEVDVRFGEAQEAAYRRCSTHHHHHLVCRRCGATVEVDAPAVERWTAAVAREHGYGDIAHTLEIVGTCSGCS